MIKAARCTSVWKLFLMMEITQPLCRAETLKALLECLKSLFSAAATARCLIIQYLLKSSVESLKQKSFFFRFVLREKTTNVSIKKIKVK